MVNSFFTANGGMGSSCRSSGMATFNLEPSTAIQIRPMLIEDVEQVHAIDLASFGMPWSERSYRYELLENPHSSLLVAETRIPGSSPLVVGAIVTWLIEDEAHIATISVHPDYRGRGISRILLASALIDAIQQGISQATLEVRAGNTIALALYRRFQFEIVGLRPRYYQDNHEDALIMTATHLDNGYLRWLETEGWNKNDKSSAQEEVPS